MLRRRSPSVMMPGQRCRRRPMNAGDAESLGAHRHQNLGHRGVHGADSATSPRAVCISVGHGGQLRTQFAAGVELARKSSGVKRPVFHERHGQRIAQRKCHRRRSRRHDAGAAGFLRRRAAQAPRRTWRNSVLAGLARNADHAGSRTGACGRSGPPVPASRRSSTAPAPRPAAVSIPRSPWLASAGCTNCAGVPVEASVAAILRATWPDLPIPDTITRPARPASAARLRAKLRSSARASVQRRGLESHRRARPASEASSVVAVHGARIQWAKMSMSGQPPGPARARVGRKSKQACASLRAALALQPASSSACSAVQVQHVRRGIVSCASLSVAAPQSELCCCLEMSTPSSSCSRYLQPVPVGVGAHQLGGDLGAVDRRAARRRRSAARRCRSGRNGKA